MGITYTIPGVVPLNQLRESSNPRMDCVFCADAELVNAYFGGKYTGSQIKAMDNNYGPSYQGGAAEKYLVDTMERLGVIMTRVASATQQGLVDAIHNAVSQHHGVLATIPSQWNSAVTNAGKSWNPRTYSGPSHVVLMAGYGPGMLRAANSWPQSGNTNGGGFFQDQSDAWWSPRLLDGEVWVGVPSSTAKETSMVPTGWKDDAATGVLTAPNGIVVVKGFRDWVLAHDWAANNTPLDAEQVVTSGSIEPGNAAIGPGSRQDFRFSSLGWTEKTNVYVIASGQDLVALTKSLGAANVQIKALEQQLAAALAQAATAKPDPNAAAALAALRQLKTALDAAAN